METFGTRKLGSNRSLNIPDPFFVYFPSTSPLNVAVCNKTTKRRVKKILQAEEKIFSKLENYKEQGKRKGTARDLSQFVESELLGARKSQKVQLL